MADATEQRIPKVRKIAGPGVSGMEHDTPMFHIDVEGVAIDRLRIDPIGFLKQLGIGAEQGIAPDGVMNVTLARPNQAWTENGWVDLDDRPESAKKKIKWCAFVVGNDTIVHNH